MDLISCKHCKRKIERDFECCPFCLGILKVEKKDVSYCPFCGQEVKKGYHNCPYCGKSLIKKQESAPKPVQTPVPEAVPTPMPKPVLASTPETVQAPILKPEPEPVKEQVAAEPMIQSAPLETPAEENKPTCCPKCGFEYKIGSKFCKNCGTKLQ